MSPLCATVTTETEHINFVYESDAFHFSIALTSIIVIIALSATFSRLWFMLVVVNVLVVLCILC